MKEYYDIVPLDSTNFHDFYQLLCERGEASEEYYIWKYQSPIELEGPRGFLARSKDDYLGCIGIIPRLWMNAAGSVSQATWFADWFVLKTERGKGVGEKLIAAVANCSSLGLGIPGSAPAQRLAGSVGYFVLNGVMDILVPINSLRFAWYYHGGTKIRRSARTLYETTAFNLMMAKVRVINKTNNELILRFPNPGEWSRKTEAFLASEAHLIRNKEYLTWLSQMPQLNYNPKIWWHWESQNASALGFIDTDRWGLKRSRVLDYGGDDFNKSDRCFIALVSAHQKFAVDYLTLFGIPYVSIPLYARLSQVPFYTLNIMGDIQVRGIDRENWWKDIGS